MTSKSLPDDLIIVGHIAGAYGVKGWARVQPYSDDAEVILTVNNWWIGDPPSQLVAVLDLRDRGDDVLVRLDAISSKEQADQLKGTPIWVSRRQFPSLEEDEYYWVDLIGLSVENTHGESFGVVSDLMDNGVHQILRIKKDTTEKKSSEILIPFIDQYVLDVDLKAKKITVDWEIDYLK